MTKNYLKVTLTLAMGLMVGKQAYGEISDDMFSKLNSIDKAIRKEYSSEDLKTIEEFCLLEDLQDVGGIAYHDASRLLTQLNPKVKAFHSTQNELINANNAIFLKNIVRRFGAMGILSPETQEKIVQDIISYCKKDAGVNVPGVNIKKD